VEGTGTGAVRRWEPFRRVLVIAVRVGESASHDGFTTLHENAFTSAHPLHMRSSTLTGAGAAIAGALAVSSSLSAQFAVAPLLLAESSGVVTIHNGEAVPARLRLSLQDFEQNPDGSNAFFPLGSRPLSCAGRARFADAPAVLAPGTVAKVRVEVEPGALCWGVLMVEASRDERPGNKVAVKFYNVPEGATRAAEIERLDVVRAGNRLAVRLEVRGLGTAPVRPFGRVEFRDESGAVVASVEVPDFGLHPGAQRYVAVPTPESLPFGRYVVLAVLDAGGPDLVAAQAVLHFPPR
jgi:hypothetical protein